MSWVTPVPPGSALPVGLGPGPFCFVQLYNISVKVSEDVYNGEEDSETIAFQAKIAQIISLIINIFYIQTRKLSIRRWYLMLLVS